jgi:uncharacterized membrane protein
MLTSLIGKRFVKQPKSRVVSEYPIRSLAKALSWRVTGSIDTLVLSWLFTGDLTIAAAIGLTEVVTKMVLYYLHERVWNRISLGKGSPPMQERESVEAPQAFSNNQRCPVVYGKFGEQSTPTFRARDAELEAYRNAAIRPLSAHKNRAYLWRQLHET